jgi:5'-nucleotidase
VEQFEKRVDPYGQPYYWLVGRFESDDAAPDTDLWALERGYVSVCPMTPDLTAHEYLGHWQTVER